jgi:hypothetical protein
VGGGHEGDVVVPARPGTPFEVVQAQAVFEFAVVVLDAPADLGQTDQVGDGSVGRQVGQPVVSRCVGVGGPLDQQPAVGQDPVSPALLGRGSGFDRTLDGLAGRADTHRGEAGT